MMNRKYIPSFALAMAFSILFSTVGLAVNVHTCDFKGTATVSVTDDLVTCIHTEEEMEGSINPLNEDKKSDSLRTETDVNCCDNEKQHLKVEVQSEKADVEQKSAVPSFISFNLIFEILYRFNFSDLFDFSPTKKNHIQDGVWPSHGQELLRLIQQYLI